MSSLREDDKSLVFHFTAQSLTTERSVNFCKFVESLENLEEFIERDICAKVCENTRRMAVSVLCV